MDGEKQYPPSVTEPLPREKLPDNLQKIVDRSDDWMDDLYEGQGPDSTSTSVRYAAYANRFRTILSSAHRYVAYTSDIGESFRPVAHPALVTTAYGISWAYLIGDVGHEGYKAYIRNQKRLYPEGPEGARAAVHIPAIEDYRSVMVERAVFQSIASMGLPALTIHSIVKYSGKALKNAANATLRTWAPIGLGLAAVPALPYMFDKPVENAVEYTFYHAFKAIGGDSAVGKPPHVVQALAEEKSAIAAKQEEKEKKACLNRTLDTGEHITDAHGNLQYIPFPTCAETDAPLAFAFGTPQTQTCTIPELPDELYHLLEFFVHSDVPLTCRVPTQPLDSTAAAIITPATGSSSNPSPLAPREGAKVMRTEPLVLTFNIGWIDGGAFLRLRRERGRRRHGDAGV
ncbi:hypothetical protein DV735_g3451, partial [Chaetothyriales sp. CBS 134920]